MKRAAITLVLLLAAAVPVNAFPPCWPGVCQVGPVTLRHCIVYADELQTECYYRAQGPGRYEVHKTFSSWNIWIGRDGVWTLHLRGDSATPVSMSGDLPTISGDLVRVLFSCPPWGCRYLIEAGPLHQSGSAGFLYAGDKDALTRPF